MGSLVLATYLLLDHPVVETVTKSDALNVNTKLATTRLVTDIICKRFFLCGCFQVGRFNCASEKDSNQPLLP